MKGFKFINKEYVAPSNLSILGNTYNTLEQGHQKAIAAAAELETAMANLDLNEAESEWRQQKIAEIRKTIDDNTVYGNSYSALDNIVKKSGQLSSDAGMIGRLQAQKDYKTYLDNLNKRTDLPESDKEYFREVNKYYYQDKYNQNGQVIGGTKWTPIDQEVAAPKMNDMMVRALQIAAKDAGGNNRIYYKDASGNYTTNESLSEDGLPYINKSGKYEKLTKEKIRAAMDAVIANTPGAIEGINQDYKIAKWRHNKNSNYGSILVIDETTDAKGLPLNRDQYLEKRITGFYQSASYNHYYENITPLAGMSISANKEKNKATKGLGGGEATNAIFNATNTTPGGFYVNRNNTLSSVVAEYKAATSMLNGEANRLGIKITSTDVADVYNKIEEYYKDRGQIIPKNVYDTYNSYLKGVDKYNQILPDKDKNNINNYLEFISALDNGIDTALYKDNPHIEEYNKIIAKAYENTEEIPLYFNINFDDAVKNFDYKSYGLKEKIDENGNKHLVLPKEFSENLLHISQATQGLIDVNNISKIPGEKLRAGEKNYNNKVFSDVLKLYNNATNNLNSQIGDVSELIPLEVVSQMDVIQTMAENAVNSGKYTDLKNAREIAKEELNASFHNAKGNQLELYIGADADHAQFEIDPNKRFHALAAAQSIHSVDPDLVTIGYDKNTLKTVISVNLNNSTNNDPAIKSHLKDAGIDSYSFTIVTDGMFNNKEKNDLMQIPEFRNSVEFTENIAAGIRKFNNKDGSIIHRISNNDFVLEREGVSIQIDKNTAKDIQGVNDLVDNLKYDYMSLVHTYGNNIPEEYIKTLNDYIIQITKTYSPVDVNATDYNSLSAYGKSVYKYLDNFISE